MCDASGNGIGVFGARVMADALRHVNSRLTSINFECELMVMTGMSIVIHCGCASGNGIGEDGARAIADALQHENCRIGSINYPRK